MHQLRLGSSISNAVKKQPKPVVEKRQKIKNNCLFFRDDNGVDRLNVFRLKPQKKSVEMRFLTHTATKDAFLLIMPVALKGARGMRMTTQTEVSYKVFVPPYKLLTNELTRFSTFFGHKLLFAILAGS